MVKPSQILHHILNLTESPTIPQDKFKKKKNFLRKDTFQNDIIQIVNLIQIV